MVDTAALCEQVLVTTDEKNYTAKDALQLLKDLNLTQQVALFWSSDCKATPEESEGFSGGRGANTQHFDFHQR